VNFSARLEKLRGKMEESRLDLFLCTKRENILYLSGFTGSSAILLVGKDDALLVTDGRYEIQAAQEVREARLEFVRDELLAIACERAAQVGSLPIGFEAASISYEGYKTLLDKAGESRVLPTYKLVEKLRMIKEEEEIASIRAACRCSDAALGLAMAGVGEGITEKELATELDYRLNKSGARKPAFDTIVAFAENAALPHATPRERLLARGEAILVDCGALVGGYCSDLTRTFFLGDPGKDAAQVYQAVLTAQRLALEALQPGKKTSEVDGVARAYLEEAGLGKAFGHGLGHGVGLEIHEEPRLNWKDETRLEVGMVATVEPGAYLRGLFGVRIEDTVVVREGKPEVLTSFPKSWEEALL